MDNQRASSSWGIPFSLIDSTSQFKAKYELNRVEHLRSSTLISREYSLKETRVISQSSTPASPQPPTYGLFNAVKLISQHLHEKHYLDRISHSFYIRADSAVGTSMKLGTGRSSVSPRAFDNMVRVLFPSPAELSDAVSQAFGNTQNPSLVSILLTVPTFRFRLCAIARLFEAALSFPIGTWEGEHPRDLSSDEKIYVIKKLQGHFRDLFQQTSIQNCIASFLSSLSVWSNFSLKVDDTEQGNLGLPEIVKKIFPCIDLIIQELRNILEAGKDDNALKFEVESLLGFIADSLKIRSYTESTVWGFRCLKLLEDLQLTLSKAKYRGPAQRLFRNIVSSTDQLWEGGGATEMGLAMEKILSGCIQKSLRKHDTMRGQDAGARTEGGWDLMDDFERLIQMATQNIAPVPLPSIVWKRKSLELCIDSMVIQFPNIMPDNIHLNSTMEFDKHSKKPCRQWSLKILGVEVEAKATPYYLTIDTPISGRIVDIGEFSFSIPANDLEIEVVVVPTNFETPYTFNTTTPSDPISPQNTNPPPYNTDDNELHNRKARDDNMACEAVAIVPKNDIHRSHTAKYGSNGNIEEAQLSINVQERSVYQKSNGIKSGDVQNGSRKKRLFSSSAENAPPKKNSLIKSYIELKNCSVRLRNLEVSVHSTKHPVLHNLVHRIIVRQVRLALEESMKQSIIDMVKTINSGIDGVMSQEALRNQSREAQSTSMFDIMQSHKSWGQGFSREPKPDTNYFSQV
ncbi:hypothetical protein BGZ76_003256 [Entomortierella beljakovae]|nr:hypothetical protein BGZ76_003256 [Entomortierella beljakovae]